MSRRGENIWHRKDGRWEARYIKGYDGKRAVYGYLYAKSYAEAKAKQFAAKQNHTEVNTTKVKGSFEEIAEAFLRCKKHHVKESTMSNYRYRIERYMVPYWKKISRQQINRITVDRFIDHLFSDYGLAAKTVKDIAVLLDSVLKFGYENGFIGISPKILTPKVYKRNIITLSRPDYEQLLRYLWLNIDYGRTGVLIALMTGMRIGEVCALKKDAFDFDNCTVAVKNTLQRITQERGGEHTTKLILSSPKSDSSARIIPLSKAFSEWLGKLYSELSDEDYVITGTDRCIEPRTYYRKYMKYLHECALDGHGYTFHALRHTFATEAIRNGMNAKSLSEILGHSSVKITLERYVHPSFEQKKQEMEKLMMCHPLQSCFQSAGAK